MEAATADIAYTLANLRLRLIVVVDDLDRMEFTALKDMLFAIKKGFFLPNVSFILCYDTQNIAALESTSYDSEKIAEFLEKFVNVKVGLYPSSDDLKRYVTGNLKIALAGNLQTDFQLLDDALGGLRSIYDSKEYHRYLPFVGDIRKIKRLVNTLVLLNIDRADFKNTDLNPSDLIHLLLVYINYPALFRIIYSAETYGRNGLFSTIAERTHSQKAYTNSPGYRDFISGLEMEGKKNESFLIEKIFNVATRLDSTDTSRLTEGQRRSYACFNSDSAGGRNLETYLNLIVRVTPPQISNQYKYYENLKDRVKRGEPLSTIIAGEELFSFKCNEFSHEQLWRVLVNSLEEFDSALIGGLIRHAVAAITDYSKLDSSHLGIGLRQSSMAYTLLKLLDAGGWSDRRGLHRDNTDENIAGIAEWIFGEGQHSGEGILELLANPARGIQGLHDALVFRLYSCSDRGGSLFTLQRALVRHSDPRASATGVLTQVVIPEMRKMSQTVFLTFKEQYISSKRNVFFAIDDLSFEELTGQFSGYVQREVDTGRFSQEQLSSAVAQCKTTLKAFTVYQLTNKQISSGVGCGYYDEFSATPTAQGFLKN